MRIQRTVLRLAIILVGTLLFVGCNRKPINDDPRPKKAPIAMDAPKQHSEDHLSSARRMLRVGELDAAAEAANKALLQDPNNVDATLVASEVEAARGNHQVAADLAGSIDIRSRLGKRAVEIHYQALVKLNQTSAAADVILAGLQVVPDMHEWRHRAWALLNRVGRREEASWQAWALCRDAQATEQELLSLVRRTRSFPFKLKEGEDPAMNFESGLGMARWYFTRKKFSTALDELSTQFAGRFESAAACALYGRLLAETQSFETFSQWHAKCDQQVRDLGDYWAALGVYFYDQRRYEASARALLESVYRNPTDRVSLQRLFKVLNSVGRTDHGSQFRDRGIKIADTERYCDLLAENSDPSVQMMLVKDLAKLGRPFETLQWTALIAGPSLSSQRQVIERQQDELRRTKKARTMASESSLIGLSLQEFSLESAMELLRTADNTTTPSQPFNLEVLARPRLVNVADEVGIEFQWYQDVEMNFEMIPVHESIGGGIAVLDYDIDGWPDAYFAQGSGDPPTDRCTRSNMLVRNLHGRFAETTSEARVEDYNYSSGLASGDVNQDGFPDLLVGSLGHTRMLINNGDGTFRDATDRLGRIDDRFTSSLAIADINGDRLPDVFETSYVEMEGGFSLPGTREDGKPELPGPLDHYSGVDRWFENKGDGSFQVHEITRDIAMPGTSIGIIVTDLDANGSNDVFVGNDIRSNHLLVHTGENQLVNVADGKGIANGYRGIPNGCMGISAADFNRDGLVDLHITNYYDESANLFIQSDGGFFTDVAIRYGIEQATNLWVGWGTKAIDIDRNGWLDLIVTNGHIFDTRIYGKEKHFRMPPQMLMSEGRRFVLTEVDDDSGYWEDIYLGRAMASLDYDRDGSIDFLIGHMDKPVALLHNQTSTDGDWIQLELVGTTTERDAIGARVVVTAGGERFTHWVTAGDGFFCTDEPVLDFGLGTGQDVARVEIFWPGREKQTVDGLQSGSRYLVVEGEPEAFRR